MPIRNSNLRRKGPVPNRRVVVLTVPPVDEFDLVCPIQVFSAANRLAGKAVYDVEVATSGKNLQVPGEAGLLSFLAKANYKDLNRNFDSLLLVCGLGTRNFRDAALFSWLRRIAPATRRLGAVCVGSFLFAEAGLLDGRRATAHWRFNQELRQRYPAVRVESAPVWVKDGNVYTSAGISAGIDLALAWVEEDCGNAIAAEVARELVLFLRRPAGQAQLSVTLAAQASEMKSIQELQVWITENLRKDLSVQILAARGAMSVRNFERVFQRELGMPPSRYVRKVRVEAAQQMLERSGKSLEQIAMACGFSGADVMRRAFHQTLAMTPRELARDPGSRGRKIRSSSSSARRQT
jgi:transcriptional regulator GlxA family with amidase domain